MKKSNLILIIAVSFFTGFAFETVIGNQQTKTTVKNVTGIGDIFFKAKTPTKSRNGTKPISAWTPTGGELILLATDFLKQRTIKTKYVSENNF